MLYGTYCKESVLVPAYTRAGRVWALAALSFQRNVDVAQWGAVGRNVSSLSSAVVHSLSEAILTQKEH